MELQLKVVLMSFPIQKETSEVAWLAVGLRQSTNGIVFTRSFSFLFYSGDGTPDDRSQGNMNGSVNQKNYFK